MVRDGGKNGDHIKRSSESLAFIPFLLCLDIKSIKDPVQEWISSPRPRRNPVSVSLQSTGPGGNASLLWLHIKIQKGISLRVYSNSFKSTTCSHCSVVFTMICCGAVLGFLGIKSIHLNQRFALLCWKGQQIHNHKNTTQNVLVYLMPHK